MNFILKRLKTILGLYKTIQTANSKLKNIKDLEEKLMKIQKKKTYKRVHVQKNKTNK
jgi:hypothetical protein